MSSSLSFKGKYFLHSGDSYYQSGEIVEQIGDILLLKIGNMGVVSDTARPIGALIAVSVNSILEEFKDSNGNASCDWLFFLTEIELQAYIDWWTNPKLGGDEQPPVKQLN